MLPLALITDAVVVARIDHDLQCTTTVTGIINGLMVAINARMHV
jgi:hypothetical protein